MTITSVRIYFYPVTKERELALSAAHWGFAEWFERRLKPIREQLRGIEAKGVNIVNLMLRENPEQVLVQDKWEKRDNTFHFEHVCDLRPLETTPALSNVEKLMQFYAGVASQAPWPQVRALSEPLSCPLTEVDRITILPFLQWPRGEMVSEAMARRMLKKNAAQLIHPLDAAR
ncbi:MAG: hypothetical protein V5B39_02430 [Accumulibacter sp.]|jgi:hypothetical protein|uniref:hypothetical protein n=1 Tax=Accumulibacter sp. TaxID=2053492 RepID=UPI002FC334E8